MIRVVAGIIRSGDKILLAERPVGKPYSGYFEFPGGKIEPDESAFAALKRELHEELGIDTQDAEHLFDYIHRYPDKTVTLSIWQVHAYEGVAYGREGQQLVWKTLAEMKDMPLLEGNFPIVELMMVAL